MSDSRNVMAVVMVVVASALLVGVFIFFGGSRSAIDSDLAAPASTSANAESLSRELLAALSSLKDLRLNTEFFKDRAFVSLIDYSEEIKTDPLGRENPFLPLQ